MAREKRGAQDNGPPVDAHPALEVLPPPAQADGHRREADEGPRAPWARAARSV